MIWLLADQLNNKGFSGGATANDGFRDIVTLSSSLIVQHSSSNRCRPGKLNYPVAIEVVLTTQVLDSKVVACGHRFSDADGGGSNRDDEHLVVASWQVAYREAVLDSVAGLSVTPTLQAGVFLLRRLQHIVTAQTLADSINTNIPASWVAGRTINHRAAVTIEKVFSSWHAVQLTGVLSSIVWEPLVAFPLEVSPIKLGALLFTEIPGALRTVLDVAGAVRLVWSYTVVPSISPESDTASGSHGHTAATAAAAFSIRTPRVPVIHTGHRERWSQEQLKDYQKQESLHCCPVQWL